MMCDLEPPAKQQKVDEVDDATPAATDEPKTEVDEGKVASPNDGTEEPSTEANEQAEEEKESTDVATSVSQESSGETTNANAESTSEEKAPPADEPVEVATNEESGSNQISATSLPPALPTAVTAPINPTIPAPLPNLDQTVEERGEVSALYVGRVIGKGGEMIRDLQARSACRIDVDQNVPPGQPRVITYRGTRKTVDFAKRLVQMLCSENASDADLPLGEAKREFVVVPAGSVGKIIGRGGEMIRELQSRSQAKIQVDHSGSSGLDQSEKQVTITGTDLAVTKAREMVLFLVANPMMDASQSINMLIEDKVHRGGVWGSGPPYPNLPNQGQNMQPNGGGGGYGYDQQYYGGQGGAQGYGASASAPYSAPGAYSGAQPSYQQQQTQASYGQYGSGGVEMEVFYAAKNFMGRIIGQKGVTINDLQRRSACDIQINQDVPPGQDCEISIRGSRQGIEMAKQMLREIIEIGTCVNNENP